MLEVSPPPDLHPPCRSQAKTGKAADPCRPGVDVNVLKTRLDGMQFNTFAGKRAVVRIAEHHADTVALNERIADIRLRRCQRASIARASPDGGTKKRRASPPGP